MFVYLFSVRRTAGICHVLVRLYVSMPLHHHVLVRRAAREKLVTYHYESP